MKEKSKPLAQRLAKIQKKLHAPKGQKNTFGNYAYRSCEDILEAVKPLLKGLNLYLSDEIVQLGDRFYVKAEVKIADTSTFISVFGWAREAEIKKGMDVSQITGAASSYARKYALNGLFCIDDTKDADTQDNSDKKAPPKKDAGKATGKTTVAATPKEKAKTEAAKKKAGKEKEIPQALSGATAKLLADSIKKAGLNPERVKNGCMLVSNNETDDPSFLSEEAAGKMIDMIDDMP